MMKTLVRTGIAAAAVLALATGCSDDGDAGTTAANTVKSAQSIAPAKESGQAPASAPANDASEPAAEPAATDAVPDAGTTPVLDTQAPNANPGGPSVEAGNPCLDTSSDLVQNVIAGMGSPPGSRYYEIGEHTTATTPNCPSLLWTFAETPSGTGSSPENILFFHGGQFVRMATPSPTAFTSIVGGTDDSLTVHYAWIVADEPNAAPQGGADVTFSWDGSTVVTDREIPPEVL